MLSETSGDLYIGGSPKSITISGEGYGALSCASSTANVTCSITNNILTITPVSAGTGTITVSEDRTNVQVTYTYEVKDTSIALSESNGEVIIGYSKSITISGTNMGTLYCGTSDNTKATCNIEGTTLTITGVAEGNATITVREGNGNKSATYTATIATPYPTVKEKIISAETPKSDASVNFAQNSNTSGDLGLYYTADAETYGEDGERIYYYRGDIDNNWISFGGYYWRIVRTTAEGGVKLVYSGGNTTTGPSSLTTTSGIIVSNTAFNIS